MIRKPTALPSLPIDPNIAPLIPPLSDKDPINVIDHLTELTHIAASRDISGQLPLIWNDVQPLLLREEQAIRKEAWKFLQVTATYPLGAMKLVYIEELKGSQDLDQKIQLAQTLCQDPSGPSLLPLVLSWFPQCMTPDRLNSLNILINITSQLVKLGVGQEEVAACIKQLSRVGMVLDDEAFKGTSKQALQQVVLNAITTLDTIVRNTHPPKLALVEMIYLLCKTVNLDPFFQPSWNCMINLLKSPHAQTTLHILCDVMDPETPSSSALVRGAIFFVGMAAWGSQRMELGVSWGYFLAHFAAASGTSITVDHEILLSLNRLVRKYGQNLTFYEWSYIVQILNNLIDRLVNSDDGTFGIGWRLGDDVTLSDTPTTLQLYNALVVMIYNLIQEGKLHASANVEDAFYKVLLDIASRAQRGTTLLNQTLALQVLQSFSSSPEMLIPLFLQDARPRIRIASMKLMEKNPSQWLDSHLLEMFQVQEDDAQVSATSFQLLLQVLYQAPISKADDLLQVLCQCVNQPTLSSKALDGLISLAQHSMIHRPVWAVKVFSYILKVIKTGKGKRLLAWLLEVRADENYRLNIVQGGVTSPAEKDSPNLSIKQTNMVCWTKDEDLEKSMEKLSLDAHVLRMDEYLDCIAHVLVQGPWEFTAYVLEYFPKQLSNMLLFIHEKIGLNNVREACCNMIQNDGLSPPKTVRKADVYAQAYKLLTHLIPYHDAFNKGQMDEMVSTFQLGLTKWAVTAKPCVHALQTCMYEMPASMIKHMTTTVTKLAQIMSSATMSVHILEFICVLARHGNLYANFVEADYKRVLGVALQYIVHSSSITSPQTSPSSAQTPIVSPLITPQTTVTPTSSTNTAVSTNLQATVGHGIHALSQYVLYLAHHAVTIWFMCIPLRDRRRYVPFIIKSLQANPLDERGEVLLDMLLRYSYSNVDPRPTKSLFSQVMFENDKNILSKSWLKGSSIITVRCIKNLAWGEVTIRRACGTTKFITRLENRFKMDTSDSANLPLSLVTHLSLQDSDNQEKEHVEELMNSLKRSKSMNVEQTKDSTGLLARTFSNAGTSILTTNNMEPSFFMTQLSNYPDWNGTEDVKPLPEEDAAIQRIIGVFDRIPAVDFHKIGVVYVGSGQVEEKSILSNTNGSFWYNYMIQNLGLVTKLCETKDIYTGGLDTSVESLDGEYAVYWEDDGSQSMFHVTTLMPTSSNDEMCTAKKRHIGNDYVLIVYNESGREYEFRTIPSQFNFVNIVITPLEGWTWKEAYFQVKMQLRPDMPEISPIFEPKIVSATSLPLFVRHVAVLVDTFAQIFYQNSQGSVSDWISNWRERLRQIKRLKDRLGLVEKVMDVEPLDFTRWSG